MSAVGATKTPREPNRQLMAVVEEAGLSNKGLAARVRAEAQRAGVDISPDHVSVRRWLDGVHPQLDTCRCIAAALSGKLGRKITLDEIGFAGETPAESDVVEEGAQYPSEPERAVELLENLTSSDLSDKPSLAAAGWVSATAPSVITSYLFGEPQRIEYATSLADAGRDIAERIRATIRYFMNLDFQFGGGHTRKMLLFYWKTEIVPALRQRYPEAIRREIFSAAADAAEVLGWSAYDAGWHGAAQRYLVQGLRLAREANDHMMGGQLLSNLSHQANYLGNFHDAIQFARAAQAATTGRATATVTAMFLAMEARALASIGEERACARVLHQAEQTFDQSNPDEDPDWISYFDAFELAGEAAHCFRDLGKADETRRFAAQAVDPVSTPQRTLGFIGMVDAAGALSGGHVDEAVSIATESINVSGALQSNRYLKYIADFYNSLKGRENSNPAVREFVELLRTSYPSLLTPESARRDASQAKRSRGESASEADTRQQSPEIRRRSA